MLAIAGSLRTRSWNRRALSVMAELAPADLELEIYDGLETIPLFNEDLEGPHTPAAVLALRESVIAADGLLLAVPEYNQSMSGVTKNLLDWLSRGTPGALKGKPIGILGATTGPWGTRLAQAGVRHTLTASAALVMPAPQLYLRDAATRLDAKHVASDADLRGQFVNYLESFARWIRLMAGNTHGR